MRFFLENLSVGTVNIIDGTPYYMFMKILILKTSALGDIIHAFPVLSYLREKFPQAQLDWVVEKPFLELLEAHPQLDRAIAVHTKAWRAAPISSWSEIKAFRQSLDHYDLVFDLQGNVKSSFLLAQIRAKKKIGFGWKSVPEFPNLLFTHCKITPPKGKNIREDYLALVQGFFNDSQPYVPSPTQLRLSEAEKKRVEAIFSVLATLVCPGAAWPNKRLSYDGMINVLREIDRPPYFFIWGTDDERRFVEELALKFPESRVLERMSLPALQYAMSLSQLVVAMDSLPLHLCGTTATPSISFFGPSSAKKYCPTGEQHQAFQGSCPYGITFEKRCPKLRTCSTGACLHEGRIRISRQPATSKRIDTHTD